MGFRVAGDDLSKVKYASRAGDILLPDRLVCDAGSLIALSTFVRGPFAHADARSRATDVRNLVVWTSHRSAYL